MFKGGDDMLINHKVKVKPSNNNKKYYLDLGYKFENGETITVETRELSNRSTVIVKFKCDNCSKIFEKPKRNVGNIEVNFCSKKCMNEYMAQSAKERFEDLIGGVSAEEFLYQKYVVERKTVRQIAQEVYGRDTSASTITRWIKTLGLEDELRHGSEAIKVQWENNPERKKSQAVFLKEMWKDGDEIRKKIKAIMQTDEYKLKQSQSKKGTRNGMYGVVGKSHPNWNPRLTAEERVKKRKIPENYKWIKMVYKRDNYTCQCCGYDKGGTLIAHHLNSWHWDKENRFNIDNGITLCRTCHIDFHHKYGYLNNTKEQFLEYLNHSKAPVI